MSLVKRKGQVAYEDLLRELEIVEQQVMQENSALAMSIMVLEAKLRDRFHQFEQQTGQFQDTDIYPIEALIPRDLPPFPETPSTHFAVPPKAIETLGLAALLAVATACGVFGLATALQLMMGWLA